MLNNLKKHSVKIFVFTTNVLLAAIAILIIREKDQARLFDNAQKEKIPNENINDNILPSFENSVPAPAVSAPVAPDPSQIQKTAPSNARTKTS